VKKLTGGFDNGLGATLIGEHGLASFLSKKSPEGISGLFQQCRPNSAIDCAAQQSSRYVVRNANGQAPGLLRHDPRAETASGRSRESPGYYLKQL